MKLSYFFIDDVIWVFRDLARQRPKSLFDNDFMRMLKRAHDENGMTAQLNLFYRTDFFYGNDEFTLAEMPDCYKDEFRAASGWLKLAFHAKQEFPDYPYVNASYEDVRDCFLAVVTEIRRFAGEESLSYALCPHWLPVSRAGCHALFDVGVRFVTPSRGDRTEYNGDPSVLPYGHAHRLLQSRQPETMLFTRPGRNTQISASICGYNHISNEQYEKIKFKNTSILDEETGLRFRPMSGGPCLNLSTKQQVEEDLISLLGSEFIGVATHEQYFYPDYYAYQPDYAEKVYLFSRILKENGYRFITWEEME